MISSQHDEQHDSQVASAGLVSGSVWAAHVRHEFRLAGSSPLVQKHCVQQAVRFHEGSRMGGTRHLAAAAAAAAPDSGFG